MYPDDNLLQIGRRPQESARLHRKLLVVAGEAAGIAARIRALQLRHHCARGHAVRRQLLGVERHPHLPRQAADDLRLRNIVQLLELVLQLARDLPELIRVVVLAPQRQRHDRHIVDGAHLDERLRHSRRNAIEV